jgi:ribonuclease HI
VAKNKFYVVWNGVHPGIYDNWEDCKLQVTGYENAVYKSFESLGAARVAYEKGVEAYRQPAAKKPITFHKLESAQVFVRESIAVDASCLGNPGDMEYRGVYVATGVEWFRIGPYKQGTNNVGEFLAVVHALALMKQRNLTLPVYSDSYNAILWIQKKQCRTRLEQTHENAPLFDLIRRAEKWLIENTFSNSVLKWDTAVWGEIPADFGRK